jgi:hypothetical protein
MVLGILLAAALAFGGGYIVKDQLSDEGDDVTVESGGEYYDDPLVAEEGSSVVQNTQNGLDLSGMIGQLLPLMLIMGMMR